MREAAPTPCYTVAALRQDRQRVDGEGLVQGGGKRSSGKAGWDRHKIPVPPRGQRRLVDQVREVIRRPRCSVLTNGVGLHGWVRRVVCCAGSGIPRRGWQWRSPYATMGRSTTFGAPAPGLAVSLAGAAGLGVLHGIGTEVALDCFARPHRVPVAELGAV